jgi:hypothetical protein
MALDKGSKDNLSCMIVLLSGGDVPGKPLDFIPGPFEVPESEVYRTAYKKMAEHAGLSLAEALDRRFEMITRELQEMEESGDLREMEKEMARKELKSYGEGPGDLVAGSEERIAWFEKWLSQDCMLDGDNSFQAQVTAMLRQEQQQPENTQPLRIARVASYEELRPAVEEHSALKWDDRLKGACAQEGHVLKDDESDGTSQVRFPHPLGFKAWLPTNMLREIKQRVGDLDELKSAVNGSASIKWDDRLETCAGQSGYLRTKNKEEQTSSVYFPPPVDAVFSLPDSALTSEEDKGAEQSTS